MNQETTELGMTVPVNLKKPASAWSGGEHTGERLTPEQRAEIRDLWAAGKSKSKIAKETGHSRNTVASIIDGDPEVGDHLRKTRATRMLVAEEDYRRVRDELMQDLEASGKLKMADLTNAMMVASVAVRDAGGAEPQRLEVSVDHSFKDAAELMNGGATREPLAFAPIPKTIEAELVLEPAALSKSETQPEQHAEA